MARFKYKGKTYPSKSSCIKAFGLNPKSTIEILSRTGKTLEEYLDNTVGGVYVGKRGIVFNNVQYKSLKDAFKENGLTDEDYARFMVLKKLKKDKGELPDKEAEKQYALDILSGESNDLKKVYGNYVIDGIEYSSIEKMVESFGYTLEQYNIYKRYRNLKGTPIEIFDTMRNDENYKDNYSVEVTYRGKTYPSIRALTDDLGYEYSIFTSRMYMEGAITPEEYLHGIETGKYEEPIRKRVLEHTKISYHVDGKGYVTQEEIAKDLGMAKVTLIHKAHQNQLSIEEMARKIVEQRKEEEVITVEA